MSNRRGPANSSPYSTGGGGTRLEHRYGALLLAALLTGDPIHELGDDVAVAQVRYQDPTSPVDDFVVSAADGRRVSVGVRRAPALTISDEHSVPLFRSYLRIITEHPTEVEAGAWRMALAVSSPNPAVSQLKQLAAVAHGCTSAADFRAEVARPGRVEEAVRKRLGHLDALVRTAAEGLRGPIPDADELTWQLLAVLRVNELRLEGADESDRTRAVASLRAITSDGTSASADVVFSRLTELSGGYASSGTAATELLLRRDLTGTPLRRSPNYAQGWALLDGLDRRLRDWTPTDLREADTRLELDRELARAQLLAAMTDAGSIPGPGVVVVTGEPDVGKSALTLRASDELVSGGAAVTALSLRDLPPTALELEADLGGTLSDVLASGPTSELRLFVIDGAEAALEGRAELLCDLGLAALRAGVGVVAVTRSEGARRVRELLARPAQLVGTAAPHEHVVAPLTEPESQRLIQTFATVRRLARDRRSRWLLGRPGLVSLLLLAAPPSLTREILSEADVFAVMWEGLVRDHEQHRRGEPTPDQRDEAMLALARRALLGASSPRPDPAVLPALRSRGLLKASDLPPAWRRTEEFASDLVRDFALARLLIIEGWDVLCEAEAPRWAIRAVRVACQVALLGPHAVSRTWSGLHAAFEVLASRFGQRWAEVPLEAVLILGDTRQALASVWRSRDAEGDGTTATLTRLASQRYTTNGFGDPNVLTPLVLLAFTPARAAELGRRAYRDDPAGVGELVLSVLRGLIESGPGSEPLREHVRDILLAAEPDGGSEFTIEALAMLGPDLDAAAATHLRQVAQDRPDGLWPAVEAVGPVLSLTRYHPTLAIDLAEAYYIDIHDHGGWSLDDGIRHHRGGPTLPQAAWYHGPFFHLLNTAPLPTLALINRILDHAALTRVRHLEDGAPRPNDPPLGVDLDLPGLEVRRCIGDEHVWAWYRGSTVGPYPCMSALLAVERFADHLIDKLAIPIDRVVLSLLRECHNLAMPGLVVGLVVRHLERAGDLLDVWLADPEVWHLEFVRVTHEGVFHVQGRDDGGVTRSDRRRLTLRDVAAKLTVEAAIKGDQERLAALAGLGDALVAAAQTQLAGSPVAADRLMTVTGWAETFNPRNYRPERDEDGRILMQYEHPEPVAAALASGAVDLAASNDALRLWNTYAANDDRSAPTDHLRDDIATARRLAVDPPRGGALFPEDPVAAVAAAAIVAVAHGRTVIPADDLRWCARVLLTATAEPRLDAMTYEGTVFPRGADRSAAAALPLLLLPTLSGLDLDMAETARGLVDCTTSLFDEVRTSVALTGRPVWLMPCRVDETGACPHQTLWNAVTEGLADVRLGLWDPQTQRRSVIPLSPPYGPSLAETATDDLLLNRLHGPLIATSAARKAACVKNDAQAMLVILLEAHRRTTNHWATRGYGSNGFEILRRRLAARALVDLAIDGDPQPLLEHARTFAGNARALQAFFADLATLFTYDDDLRHHLEAVWRQALTAVLDALDNGADFRGNHHWADYAIASLLPTPQLDTADRNPDATLDHARAQWVTPDRLADLVVRWLPTAAGEPKAADALAQWARCGPPAWQANDGLTWAEQIVDGRYNAFANRCWFFTDWLGSLRENGSDSAQSAITAKWRRLVDSLAAAGDRRAAELQQLEE